MKRMVSLGLLLALAALGSNASGASAECQPVPVTDDIRDYIGVAFTATVVEEVTDEADPPMGDSPAFDWKVVLDVDRVYRGTVEDTLHWHGYALGCSGIRPLMLKEGQRLFVSTDQLDPEGLRAPGHFTVIWKKDGDSWRFFPRVMKYGYSDDWYPPEASSASNLRQIRKTVGALHRPYDDPVPRQDIFDQEANAAADNSEIAPEDALAE